MLSAHKHKFLKKIFKGLVFFVVFSLVASYFYIPFSALPLPEPVKEKLAQLQPEI